MKRYDLYYECTEENLECKTKMEKCRYGSYVKYEYVDALADKLRDIQLQLDEILMHIDLEE